MKVVILSPSLDTGGPTNVIYNMLEAYSMGNYDFQVSIVAISDSRSYSRQNEFESIGIKVDCLHIPKGIKGLLYTNKVRKALLREQPDIIHAHGLVPEFILSILYFPRVKKVASQFCFQFEDYAMLYGKFVGTLLSEMTMLMYKHFDMVIPCSEYITNQVKVIKKRMPYKYHVIHTGVSAHTFEPLTAEKKVTLKTKLGIPLDKKIFIYIAVFIKRKNPEILVKAFSELKRSDSLLLMMGDGDRIDACKKICNDSDIVQYIGSQPSTIEYLQVSDYLISASYSEGFPTAVLEAMSVGVAPILSNIGPHVEMVGNASLPMLFDADDKEGLKDLICNPDKSVDYRDFFLKNFSSDVMIEEHSKLYYNLLS